MPRSVLALLVGPAAVRAGGRRPAREIATREPAARSGRSRRPPWPCRHPPAPRPGPAAHGRRSLALLHPPAPSTPVVQPEFAIELVACGSAGVLGAVGPGRPRDRHTRACGSEWSISKPARALRSLRRPPHQWRLVADVWLGALTRCPARLRHSPWASQISRVKPVSPLLAQGEPQMKPPSPLRVRNGCFGSVFRLQW